MSVSGVIAVLSAGYDNLADAEADFEAVEHVFEEAGEVSSFDAAVIDFSVTGKPRLAREQTPSSQPTEGTSAWGRAVRIARYLYEGLATVGGEAGGSAGGTLSEPGSSSGVDADDLEKLGAALKRAAAGLFVAFPTGMAVQVSESIHARDRYVSSAVDADFQKLDTQITNAVRRSVSPPDETS